MFSSDAGGMFFIVFGFFSLALALQAQRGNIQLLTGESENEKYAAVLSDQFQPAMKQSCVLVGTKGVAFTLKIKGYSSQLAKEDLMVDELVFRMLTAKDNLQDETAVWCEIKCPAGLGQIQSYESSTVMWGVATDFDYKLSLLMSSQKDYIAAVSRAFMEPTQLESIYCLKADGPFGSVICSITELLDSKVYGTGIKLSSDALHHINWMYENVVISWRIITCPMAERGFVTSDDHEKYTGIAKRVTFDKTNRCRIRKKDWNNQVAAISPFFMAKFKNIAKNPYCNTNSCIRVRNLSNGKEVYAKIVDTMSSDSETDVGLSSAAFNRIAPNENEAMVQWNFVVCDVQKFAPVEKSVEKAIEGDKACIITNYFQADNVPRRATLNQENEVISTTLVSNLFTIPVDSGEDIHTESEISIISDQLVLTEKAPVETIPRSPAFVIIDYSSKAVVNLTDLKEVESLVLDSESASEVSKLTSNNFCSSMPDTLFKNVTSYHCASVLNEHSLASIEEHLHKSPEPLQDHFQMPLQLMEAFRVNPNWNSTPKVAEGDDDDDDEEKLMKSAALNSKFHNGFVYKIKSVDGGWPSESVDEWDGVYAVVSHHYQTSNKIFSRLLNLACPRNLFVEITNQLKPVKITIKAGAFSPQLHSDDVAVSERAFALLRDCCQESIPVTWRFVSVEPKRQAD